MGLRRTLANSPVARGAALPVRAATVARYDVRVLGESARWLVRSREHTNFTYDLTPLNLQHLSHWVAAVTGGRPEEARGFIQELGTDEQLAAHVLECTLASSRRGIADREIRFGRRLGWYALLRVVKPSHVVETGTDKGLGSCVLAAALLKNGTGRLTTIDMNEDSGYLIQGRYAEVTGRVIGDSIRELAALDPADIFLHDSLHTYEHETTEYETVKLSSNALVLSDNAHSTAALPDWAERTGHRFLFFAEQPERHWYPGSGIGAAW